MWKLTPLLCNEASLKHYNKRLFLDSESGVATRLQPTPRIEVLPDVAVPDPGVGARILRQRRRLPRPAKTFVGRALATGSSGCTTLSTPMAWSLGSRGWRSTTSSSKFTAPSKRANTCHRCSTAYLHMLKGPGLHACETNKLGRQRVRGVRTPEG